MNNSTGSQGVLDDRKYRGNGQIYMSSCHITTPPPPSHTHIHTHLHVIHFTRHITNSDKLVRHIFFYKKGQKLIEHISKSQVQITNLIWKGIILRYTQNYFIISSAWHPSSELNALVAKTSLKITSKIFGQTQNDETITTTNHSF